MQSFESFLLEICLHCRVLFTENQFPVPLKFIYSVPGFEKNKQYSRVRLLLCNVSEFLIVIALFPFYIDRVFVKDSLT